MTTPEQQARQMLGRMKVEHADYYSAGDLVELAALIAERDALKAELERERMRLVACGVVAMADTPESAARERKMHPDYESAACADVARRVDECMRLRAELAAIKQGTGEPSTRPAVPLTDESIRKIAGGGQFVDMVFADGARGVALDAVTICDFAHAIEAAHGIKGA